MSVAQYFTVHGKQEIDAHLGAIYSSAERTYHWIKQHYINEEI
jgi:hypothetical protein